MYSSGCVRSLHEAGFGVAGRRIEPLHVFTSRPWDTASRKYHEHTVAISGERRPKIAR